MMQRANISSKADDSENQESSNHPIDAEEFNINPS
jgi:hypothetical protein